MFLTFLSWVLGAILLIVGLLLASVDLSWQAMGGILAALLVLPPVRRLVYSKTNFKIHFLLRVILVFLLTGWSGSYISQKVRQEGFKENGPEIVQSIEKLIAEKEYQKALSKASIYEEFGGDRIRELKLEAQEKYDVLKGAAIAEANEQKAIQEAKAKQDQADAEAAAAINKPIEDRKKLVESQFSAWSGAHRNLERLVEKGLNDPDSYEHIETRFKDEGSHVMVYMTYRARNGFGGMVRGNVIAKTSLQGDILEIVEQN